MSDLNDPRVFFAAERTLLAWNRTALALMAFGFVIERSGLFARLLAPGQPVSIPASVSTWIGMALILLGASASVASVFQFRKTLRDLKPVEIPPGYRVNLGVFANLAIAAIGIVLSAFLFHGN
jgi:putative membrane protein